MASFQIVQTALMTNNFDVLWNGAPFVRFDGIKFGWGGAFVFENGYRYEMKNPFVMKAAASVLRDGMVVCEGEAHGMFRSKRYVMTCQGRTFELQATSVAGSGYQLMEQGQALGWALNTSMGRSDSQGELPETVPLEVNLLVLWFMAREGRNNK